MKKPIRVKKTRVERSFRAQPSKTNVSGSPFKDPRFLGGITLGVCVAIAMPTIAASTGSASSISAAGASATAANASTQGQTGVNTNSPSATPNIQDNSLINTNGVVEEEAADCADPDNPDGLAAAQKAAIDVRTEILVVPTNTDSLFDPNSTTGAGQCLQKVGSLIDLSSFIPSTGIPFLDSVLSTAQNALVQKTSYRVCSSVQAATQQAMEPLMKMQQTLQDPRYSGLLQGAGIAASTGNTTALNGALGSYVNNGLLNLVDQRVSPDTSTAIRSVMVAGNATGVSATAPTTSTTTTNTSGSTTSTSANTGTSAFPGYLDAGSLLGTGSSTTTSATTNATTANTIAANSNTLASNSNSNAANAAVSTGPSAAAINAMRNAVQNLFN